MFSVLLFFLSSHYLDFIVTRDTVYRKQNKKKKRAKKREKRRRQRESLSCWFVCVCLLVSHMYVLVLFCICTYVLYVCMYVLYVILLSSMVFRVWIFCWLSERAGAHGCQVSATQVLSLTHLTEPNLSSPICICIHTSKYIYTYKYIFVCVYVHSQPLFTQPCNLHACVLRPIIPKHSCSLKNSLKHYSMFLIELLTIYQKTKKSPTGASFHVQF